MAKRIIDLMPPHLHYVEPYAGGLAVLLAKDPEGVSEVVNDLNGSLTNFWDVLRSVEGFNLFIRRVETTPFSELEWIRADAMSDFPPSCNIERVWAFFVRCRQSMAGRMASFAPLSRNRTRRGMNEQVSAWLNAVEGLPEVHERLRRVVILNRDALDVIRQQDGKNTLFYLDPPYLHETRSTTNEYGDFEMTEEQHRELLTTLVSIEGKFLLSAYPSQLYKEFELLYGWKKQEFTLPNNASSGKKKPLMTECVYMNY